MLACFTKSFCLTTLSTCATYVKAPKPCGVLLSLASFLGVGNGKKIYLVFVRDTRGSPIMLLSNTSEFQHYFNKISARIICYNLKNNKYVNSIIRLNEAIFNRPITKVHWTKSLRELDSKSSI